MSAPVLEENAHLRATITNTTERVLLTGNASIFLGSEYVGTTKVKMTAPNEQFQIFLGIDDALKIKREPIERAVDKGNLLQNDLRRSTYAYLITAHNYAATPRKIVIQDHLPVPQHERIKVKVFRSSHSPQNTPNWNCSPGNSLCQQMASRRLNTGSSWSIPKDSKSSIYHDA